MAQAVREDHAIEDKMKDHIAISSSTSSSGSFKFNAHAPEFKPRSTSSSSSSTYTPQVSVPMSLQVQVPVPVPQPIATGYFHPCFQYIGASAANDQWIYVSDQDTIPMVSNTMPRSPKHVLTEALQQKIIKQVEYQFSDLGLLANENLVKHIHKDPKGFVPISFVASTKKLNSLINNNHQLAAQALQASTKLEVSSDGKRVKRRKPFTDKEKEELQSRTVVAENLPDNHSHQNIEKIFKVAGSVKAIRICHPQEPSSSRSRVDYVISNKLHALIEFDNMDSAEKAVDKLNDERNWRKGLRVRLLLRRTPKSVLKSRRSGFDSYLDEDTDEDDGIEVLDDSPQAKSSGSVVENNTEESSPPSKKEKGWGKGRGKSRLRTQISNSRGLLSLLSQPSQSSSSIVEGTPKPIVKGPRMPDGTKGFNMGRGKPINTIITSLLTINPAVGSD